MKISQKLSILFFAFVLTACVETKISSYVDPAYRQSQFTKITLNLSAFTPVIRAQAEPLIAAELRNAGVEVVNFQDVVPPTRELSKEEVVDALNQAGVQAVFHMRMTDSTQSSQYLGSYTTMNANAYSYGGSSHVTGNSTSVPIVSAKSQHTFEAILIDTKTGAKAWQCQIFSDAQGTLFAGNVEAIAKSVAKTIATKLKEDGLIGNSLKG